jgi:hypothetical protein
MKTNTLQDKLNQLQGLYDAECDRSEAIRHQLLVAKNDYKVAYEIIEGYRSEVSRLQKVAELARDAVEAGAVDECYLSLLRDAVSALPNDQDQTAEPSACL